MCVHVCWHVWFGVHGFVNIDWGRSDWHGNRETHSTWNTQPYEAHKARWNTQSTMKHTANAKHTARWNTIQNQHSNHRTQNSKLITENSETKPPTSNLEPQNSTPTTQNPKLNLLVQSIIINTYLIFNNVDNGGWDWLVITVATLMVFYRILSLCILFWGFV